MEASQYMNESADRRYAQVAEQQAEYEAFSPKQLAKKIKQLEEQMYEYAKNLEFEEAAKVRDTLQVLQDKMLGLELGG